MTDFSHLQRLSRELTDRGKLIEAGWISLRIAAIPPDAPAIQLEEMRNAFFAGAQYLFVSLMTLFDLGAGDEPVDRDLARMELIEKELRAFAADFEARNIPTKGSA